MKIKCYSVRLKSIEQISQKAFRVISFDGSVDIIPSSQVFGQDYSVKKSDAYWIAAWILEKKAIQYSTKKESWYNSDNGEMMPSIKIETHVPTKIDPITPIADASLIR